MMGWFSSVLVPVARITSDFKTSLMGFVMAPLPKEAARPATVEECQRRAQWSTLFVPIDRADELLKQVVFLVGAPGG